MGGVQLFVLHDIYDADLDYAAAGFDVVVSGHTHQAEALVKEGVLFINPGSAGPWRPNTRASVGRLLIDGKVVTPQLLELDVI